MTKKTLGSNLLKDATKEAQAGKINLESTVLMTPEQLQPREKRTAGRMVYITPSEMEKFLSMIGRETYSNAVRDLILAFIKKNNGK